MRYGSAAILTVQASRSSMRAPKSFTGTSGVVRFDRGVGEVMDAMMDFALEHHVAMVYGAHRAALRALAAEMGVGVVELA